MPFCPACGNAYFEGRQYCGKCGAKLPAPEQPAAPEGSAASEPAITAQPSAWETPISPTAPAPSWISRNGPLVFVAVAILIVGVAAVVFLGKKSSTPTGYFTGNGFRLRPPAGWRVDTSGSFGSQVFFFGPTTAGFRANINVVKGPSSGLSLSDYAARTRDAYPRLFTGYRLIENHPITVQGRDAYILGGTFTQGAFTVRDRQLFVIKGDTVYAVTATDSSADWPIQDATFESCIETFQPT